MISIKMEEGDFVWVEKTIPDETTSDERTYMDWALIDGTEALAQRLRNRLKLFAGEWFLDQNAGIDWLGLLEKPFSLRRLRSALKTALLDDEGVDDIDELAVEPDFKQRKLEVRVTIVAGSEKIQLAEEIE